MCSCATDQVATSLNQSCVPDTMKAEHYAGNLSDVCCFGHTMGFAKMVLPLVRFVLKYAQ